MTTFRQVQSSIDCPLIGLKKPLVHQSVHQFTPRVHHGCREKCAIEFQPRRSDSAGLFFWKLYIQIWDRWEITGSYFLRSLRLLNRCSGRFFAFWNRHKKIFEKVWESRKKIRQRESEKAKSHPGTLKISYTFIRYIPWANSQMKVRQDPPAANGISGTKGGERPRNHSEISGSYGYGHDRLRV